jgi:hypothetical protein
MTRTSETSKLLLKKKKSYYYDDPKKQKTLDQFSLATMLMSSFKGLTLTYQVKIWGEGPKSKVYAQQGYTEKLL